MRRERSRQRDGFLWMESAAAVGAVGGEIDGLLHCDQALLVASLPLHPECDAEEKDAPCKRRRPYSLKGNCPLSAACLRISIALRMQWGQLRTWLVWESNNDGFFRLFTRRFRNSSSAQWLVSKSGSYFRRKVAKAIPEPLFRKNFARVRHRSSCLRDLY